jgi:hypothetical protein
LRRFKFKVHEFNERAIRSELPSVRILTEQPGNPRC